MRSVLYLPNGEVEFIDGNPEEGLQKIVRERLGRDAELLLREVIASHDLGQPPTVLNQKMCLVESVAGLNSVLEGLKSKRINREKLQTQIRTIQDRLHELE